jgi:hypothetical protein
VATSHLPQIFEYIAIQLYADLVALLLGLRGDDYGHTIRLLL